MHNLGDSFGFRRSDESLWSGAEGGFKVPADATDWKQGDLVTIDPANPGYLKLADAGAALVPGVTGLLVQYDQLFVSAGLTRDVVYNTRDLGAIVPGAPAVIATGAGLKVWVKNLAAVTGSGRRNYPAETRCVATGIALGDSVSWDGAKYVETADTAAVIGTVTGEITSAGFTFVLNA